ncbi:MAG: penicillin acylase family protein [Hyphomicrobiales bacterium]|nr:penicillin acylase family protein [Hyphomicrobiales bacterium]
MSRRNKAAAIWVFAFIILILAAAAGSGLWWWRQSLPAVAGEVKLPGLSGNVRVIRDNYGVPHIFAENLRDAGRTLGYLHAQDRFFQMDISRRVLEGRLAKIIGPDGLEFDRLFLTLDLAGSGRASFKALSPDAQAQLQAYADGVNSWLGHSGQELPLEYALLDFEPEPWRPEDAVIWGKGMAWKLSANWRQDAARAKLLTRFDRGTAERLFPLPKPDWPITLDPQLSPSKTRSTRHSPARFEPSTLARDLKAFQSLAALPSYGAGASNEWVIAGARSETGKPILANDPHLDLTIPILWYLARITTPEITITGATVPGTPHVLLGQNGHIAWGFTTTDSDVQDLFIETVDPEDPGRYLTPDGPTPFKTETRTIQVKGEEPVEFIRRETRHGPVISGALDGAGQLAAEGEFVSLAWTGLSRDDTSAEAVYRLGLARNRQEFLNAMRQFHSPTQNIAYADREGTIGFVNAGRVPIRKSGDGRYPVDGASGEFDWTGEIDFSGWPKLFDPPEGAIVNANNAVTRNDAGYWFGRDETPPYRAERILELIAEKPKHDLNSMAAIQSDIQAVHARYLLPFILKVEPGAEVEEKALKLLATWDMNADWNGPETLILDWWLRQMNVELLSSSLDPMAPVSGSLNASVVANILNEPGDFCEQANAGANCMDAVSTAFSKTIADLAKRYGDEPGQWRWGDEHVAVMENQVLDNLPGFRDLFGVSFPSDGGFYSVNRGGSIGLASPDHPLVRKSGAGFRGVYDLGDPSQSRFIIAGGQSAHPLSPHYADQLELYKRGEYIRLQIAEDELRAAGRPELRFTP